MKRAFKVLFMVIAAATLLTACSSPPADKVAEANNLINSMIASGAEQFAPAKMQSITSRYNEALGEIKKQEANVTKNYSMAVFLLDQLMDDCDQLKNQMAQSKGEPVVAIVPRLKPYNPDR